MTCPVDWAPLRKNQGDGMPEGISYGVTAGRVVTPGYSSGGRAIFWSLLNW